MQFFTMSKLLEKFLIYTEAKIDTMGREGWRSARDRLTYYREKHRCITALLYIFTNLNRQETAGTTELVGCLTQGLHGKGVLRGLSMSGGSLLDGVSLSEYCLFML